MTILKYIISLTVVFLGLSADAKSCSQVGLVGSSLISNVTTLLGTVSVVSGQGEPKCEAVKVATCSATFYGKGDNFTSGTTACGDKFRPMQDKTVALKTVGSGGFFSKSLCGKKAVISSYDPETKRTKYVEVRVTDSGSMGGRSSKRCMDLSYRAAYDLGIIKRGVASNTEIKICK